MSALDDLLAEIHKKLAQQMLDRLDEGPADARDWAVIVKFLKDNGVDSLKKPGEEATDPFAALMERARASVGQHN